MDMHLKLPPTIPPTHLVRADHVRAVRTYADLLHVDFKEKLKEVWKHGWVIWITATAARKHAHHTQLTNIDVLERLQVEYLSIRWTGLCYEIRTMLNTKTAAQYGIFYHQDLFDDTGARVTHSFHHGVYEDASQKEDSVQAQTLHP